MIATLKSEKFDVVIDLHNNLRTSRIKRSLGVPAHRFPKLNIEKWLLVNLKWDRMPKIHIVDRYLSAVSSLGVKNDGAGLDFFIPQERAVKFSDLPATHQKGYTALAIGAAHVTKRLRNTVWIELVQMIEGPLVLIGGEDDARIARGIANKVGGRAWDVTGKYDILGSASLIQQARSVIAHDSGAMHIACAYRKNVVSIWGNTVPAFGMGPYIPTNPERAHISEVLGLPCRPCSKIGYIDCPKGHFHCMEKHDLQRIATWPGSSRNTSQSWDIYISTYHCFTQ